MADRTPDPRDPTRLPARGLAAFVRAGELRAGEILESCLARIAACDGGPEGIGAFLEIFEARAWQAAEAVDDARRRGQALGPLAGVPVAIKDNLLLKGQRASCGSRILSGFVAPYTASAVARLEAAGAVVLGRSNMDEFGMGSSTEHSAYQRTRNPYALDRVPGGSSGGSAAAVAARMLPLALGSDTGGSVRQPAALCGVSGLKPTYGRISRYGLVAYASSLDQIGPLARTAEDLALALSVMAGHDRADSTSLEAPVEDYLASLEAPGEAPGEASGEAFPGLRIGVPEGAWEAGLDTEVEGLCRAALDSLVGLGAKLQPLRLPHADYATAAYYILATAEASSNLARFDGVRYGLRASEQPDLQGMYEATRTQGFGEEVKLRILLGAYCLCSGYYDAYYHKAGKLRSLIRRDFEEAFQSCDLLATPTYPIPAFRFGEQSQDRLATYLCDRLTTPANLAGIPALSLPCGFTATGLPVGLQLLGPPLAEARLLRAAAAYQRATDHHEREPDL